MNITDDLRKRRKAARRRIRRESKGAILLTVEQARMVFPDHTRQLIRQLREHGLDERQAQFWTDRRGVHVSLLFEPGKVRLCDLAGDRRQ